MSPIHRGCKGIGTLLPASYAGVNFSLHSAQPSCDVAKLANAPGTANVFVRNK